MPTVVNIHLAIIKTEKISSNDDNQCSVIHNNRIVKISKDFGSLYSLFQKFFGLDVCHVLCL